MFPLSHLVCNCKSHELSFQNFFKIKYEMQKLEEIILNHMFSSLSDHLDHAFMPIIELIIIDIF